MSFLELITASNTKKINQFEKKGIHTLDDLAFFGPRKYIDISTVKNVKTCMDQEIISIIVEIKKVEKRDKNLSLRCKDVKGNDVYVFFFGRAFLEKQFSVGDTWLFAGTVKKDNSYSIMMGSPIYMSKDVENIPHFIPVYSKIEGMTDDYLRECVKRAITMKDEYLENSVLDSFDLADIKTTLLNLHFPKSFKEIETARMRILFEKLFQLNMVVGLGKKTEDAPALYPLKNMNSIKAILEKIPFELTEDQRSVLRELYISGKKKEINALVQGDVGAGKTIVAAIMAAQMCIEGHQCAVMAPTQILAAQHFEEFSKYMGILGIDTYLLTSGIKKRERTKILKEIASDKPCVVIGTQSLLSEEVAFSSLAMLIVDEEHRFGVRQRDSIKQKAKGVHYIAMSATPIPRSLALSIFGAMDVFEIKSMPKGRKPIKTHLLKDDSRAVTLMRTEIAEKRQVYMICPLISESESELMSHIEDTNSLLERMRNLGFNCDIATGEMKEQDVTDVLTRFKNQEFDVLVSTTIVEVGVNNPNASVMVIQNAERFGLSQLHQLRGRVGRGSDQSYCILVSEADTERLGVLCKTTDGFEISKEDLRLRGAGNLVGVEQSGYAEEFELILSNPEYNEKIRKEIELILSDSKRKKYYKETIQNLIK